MMLKVTEKALRKSIKHWQENLAADKLSETSTGGCDCALCNRYKNDCSTLDGCPVYNLTKRGACNNTPYQLANMSHADWFISVRDDARASVIAKAKADWRKAAKQELDFLSSLLPENAGADTNDRI